ncbi:MAG TPA: BMP family ABC transporter substrate-binding protein, partial [Anaerolineae bacterium]|nr:BMP family ABC transporter substrate-binding protein [Anaerolineae bacterium]
MRKKLLFVISGLVVLALLVTACGKATPEPTAVPAAPTAVPTKAPATATPVPPTPEPVAKFKVGMVSDVGGIDDASFNENTWKGLEDAVAAFGVEAAFLESQAQADYEPN